MCLLNGEMLMIMGSDRQDAEHLFFMMGQGSRLIVAPAVGETIKKLRCFCCCYRCCCCFLVVVVVVVVFAIIV